MDPAGGSLSSSAPWEPWPARSGAEVTFLLGEQPAAERIARRLFGRTLRTWEYAGLAGAPDNARVEVGTSVRMLYIEMGDPTTGAYRAYFHVRRDGPQLVLINDGFHIHLRALSGRGFGLHVFHRQATNAAAMGLHCIETTAGRRRDENGYYTWPRFGFDGALPARLRRRLPIGLDDARTVLDLMECENGRLWWREHGATIGVTFDLSAGSRSWLALHRYMRARKNFGSGPKRNLEKRAVML